MRFRASAIQKPPSRPLTREPLQATYTSACTVGLSELELGAGDQPRVTERSKNPKGSAAIRGKPILPLRKTLERRTSRATARGVESAREDGPGRKP